MMHTQYKHTDALGLSPRLSVLPGMSTSSHTPGRPVPECDEESEAVVTQRRHTGYPNPSSLDPAPLELRNEMSRETEMCEGWGTCWGLH